MSDSRDALLTSILQLLSRDPTAVGYSEGSLELLNWFLLWLRRWVESVNFGGGTGEEGFLRLLVWQLEERTKASAIGELLALMEEFRRVLAD
jgi:hypothetical protein